MKRPNSKISNEAEGMEKYRVDSSTRFAILEGF
jgi:hypothetical protein